MSDILIYSPGVFQSYGHSYDYSKGLSESLINRGFNVYVFGVDGPLKLPERIKEIRVENATDVSKKQTPFEKIIWGFRRVFNSGKTLDQFVETYKGFESKPLVIFETFEYFSLGNTIKDFSGNCFSIFHDTNFNFSQTSLIAGIYKILARIPARKIVKHSKMSFVHGIQMKKNLLAQLGQALSTKLQEIPYGAPLPSPSAPEEQVLAKKELGLLENKKYMLSFGTLRTDKEFLPIIEALRKTDNWQWIIAGPEGDFSYNKILETIGEFGVTDKVFTIERFIKNDEQRQYFAASDVVVNLYKPFIRHESGTAQLARTYVKPVIVSGPPDLTDYVTRKNIGWVLNRGMEFSKILTEIDNLSLSDKNRIDENIIELANANSWKSVVNKILSYN